MGGLKNRIGKGEKLRRLKDSTFIGQRFRGQSPEGIGIGNCTAKCAKNVKGCPPSAKDILEFLEKQI